MAKKRTAPAGATPKAITSERAARLNRLLRLLSAAPQSRDSLKKRLRLDLRGFYRDLEMLRAIGIDVSLHAGKYTLAGDVESAVARLPFPDPGLTLGEAMRLARGRTAAHRRLAAQIAQIIR